MMLNKLLQKHFVIFFQSSSEADNGIGIGLGDLVNGHLKDAGLGVPLTLSHVICTTFGPNLLQVLLDQDGCSSGIFTPTIFDSWPDFCKMFNDLPPRQRKCFSPAVVDVRLKLIGISDGYQYIGKCCFTSTSQVGITHKKHPRCAR